MLTAFRSLFARDRKPARRARARSLDFDRLEGRELPAISVTSLIPTLVINADTNGFNNVVVTREATFNGGQAVFVRNNNVVQRVFNNPVGLESILFNGSANGDVFTNKTSIPSAFFGNGGNDTFVGGTSIDTASGGAGDDAINGGPEFSPGLRFPDTFTETADANFTVTDPTPDRPGVTRVSGLGNDLLVNVNTVRLTGGSGNNTFDTRSFTGNAVLNGGDGHDLFRLGRGLNDIDGGANSAGFGFGDGFIIEGVTNGLFEAGRMFALGSVHTVRGIERAIVNGTAGNDAIDMAGWGGVLTISALGGNDVLRGGSGNNIIDPGAGFDVVLPNTGRDFSTLSSEDILAGPGGRRLTPAELDRTEGRLAVILRDVPGKKALDVFGPSGAGFSLEGNWTVQSLPGTERFSLTGLVKLKTALGDITVNVPTNLPLVFDTQPDRFTSYGEVTNVSWNAPMALSTQFGPLSVFKNQFGLDLNLPGVGWGLKLGKDIPGSADMGLNPTIAYLFAQVNTGFSASFGGFAASTPGASITVAFDPSDPSIYVRSSLPAEFSVGLSAKGYLPFRPEQPLPGNPRVFGNVLAGASFDLGAVPVTLSGEAVIDFDANDDGNVVGVTPDLVQRLIRGQVPLEELALGALNDVAVGINGTAGVGFEKAGFSVGVTTAAASAAYVPGRFSFRGGQVNPFAGTPLEFFNIGQAGAEGTVTTDGQFDIKVFGGLGGVLGTLFPNQATLRLTNQGVTLTGDALVDVTLPLVGEVFKANLHAEGSLTVSNGAVRFQAALTVSPLNIGPDNLINFRGRIDASLDVIASGGGQFAISGRLTGNINSPGVPSTAVNIGVALSNNELRVTLAPGLEFAISFNSAPAFTEQTLKPVAVVGDVVQVRGRITEFDRSDAFFLDVDWGDGSPIDTRRFPAGSDGKVVWVSHIFRTPSPIDFPRYVTVTWRDPHGASNSSQLAIVVLAPPTGAAVRAAGALGTVAKPAFDFDGDGVADLLAVRAVGGASRIDTVSGRTGQGLGRVNVTDVPVLLNVAGFGGTATRSYLVSRSMEEGRAVLTFHDATSGELMTTVRV